MNIDPYKPPSFSSKSSSSKVSNASGLGRELTVSEKHQIRKLILDRVHPSKFDAHCLGIGMSQQEVDDLLTRITIRRSLLLDAYRIKRSSQIAGIVVILIGVGFLLTLSIRGFVAGSAIMAYGFAMHSSGSIFLVSDRESVIRRVKQI